MRARFLKMPAVVAVAAALAACSLGQGLTTGSVSGAGGPPEEKPVTPTDRAVHVGATVARAQRCGFFFDPDQVRSGYLAAEQQAGTAPEVLQKVTREFDYTRQTIAAAAAKDEAYCTEGRTREVKAALGRQLAGDFNPPRRRSELSVSWNEHQKRDAPFDGQKVFDASQKKIGPRDE